MATWETVEALVEFVGMNSISPLQPGYYAGLERFPFNNPTKGGMTIALGNGCNLSSAWFVVDSVRYSGDTLYQATYPPSMVTLEPVMKAASALAR